MGVVSASAVVSAATSPAAAAPAAAGGAVYMSPFCYCVYLSPFIWLRLQRRDTWMEVLGMSV